MPSCSRCVVGIASEYGYQLPRASLPVRPGYYTCLPMVMCATQRILSVQGSSGLLCQAAMVDI